MTRSTTVIDGGVGAFRHAVDGPRRHLVAQAVEIDRHPQQRQRADVRGIDRVTTGFEAGQRRSPPSVRSTADLLGQGRLQPTSEAVHGSRPHRLRLRVPAERRRETPPAVARSLRQIDQLLEPGRFQRCAHDPERTTLAPSARNVLVGLGRRTVTMVSDDGSTRLRSPSTRQDPDDVARFWSHATRAGRPHPSTTASVELTPTDVTTFAVVVRPGGGAKTGQNRIHFDLTTGIRRSIVTPP